MNARPSHIRRCTRPRWMPAHAAHAASIAEHEDYTWDDSPVTAGEFVREFVGGALIIGGALLVAWLVLAS